MVEGVQHISAEAKMARKKMQDEKVVGGGGHPICPPGSTTDYVDQCGLPPLHNLECFQHELHICVMKHNLPL